MIVPLCSAGVASPRALCAVLGTTVQKGRETTGECPEKGYKDGDKPRGDDVRGAAEVTGPVQPGEEEAEGGPHGGLQLPHEGEWRGRRLSLIHISEPTRPY